MELDSLEDVLAEQIGDLQSAEGQLAVALRKMANEASLAKLRDAFEAHQEETTQHIKRLDEIVERLGRSVVTEESAAMRALIGQAEKVMAAGGALTYITTSEARSPAT